MKINVLCLVPLIVLSISPLAHAHSGRRLEVQVRDSQLFAQGYLSGSSPEDDGAGLVRSYYNAIHDHWTNVGPVAVASLPGLDIHDPAGLLGYNLIMTLTGSGKWEDPMGAAPGAGPTLSALDDDETIYIGFDSQPDIDTDTLGSFTLAENIAGPISDIDLQYQILLNPINTLYFLQWQLSTDAPGIAASEPVYTILSPDKTATNGLHHASLMLESRLGIAAIPEPSAVMLLALGTVVMTARRRQRQST